MKPRLVYLAIWNALSSVYEAHDSDRLILISLFEGEKDLKECSILNCSNYLCAVLCEHSKEPTC